MKLSQLSRFIVLALTSLLLAAVISGAAWAQQGKGSARALVENLYTQPGLLPVRDLVVELECADTSQSGNMAISAKDKIYYKYPNKLRIDSVIQDPGGAMDQKQVIVIRDGINAWHYVSMGQYPVKKALDQPSATLNLPFNIQHYPVDNTKTYEIIGSKQIEGVNTQEVRITNPQDANDVKTVYIDAQRRVPIRLELTKVADKNKVKVRVDYKSITKLSDGRYFPFSIEIYENDTLARMRVYKGVKANVGIQDSLFEPMKGFTR